MKEPTLETRIGQKGQVTIPLSIRTRLGLKPKDRVRFEVEGDAVKLTTVTSRVARSFGALASDVPALEARAERAAYEEGVAAEASQRGR